MRRFTSCVTTALILTIVAGCGNSNAPSDIGAGRKTQPADDVSTGTDDSQAAKEPDDASAKVEATESKNVAAIESSALKQAMIDVTADLMKQQQPDTELDAIREQVENGIAQIRKAVPNFLMVSVETEKKLQAGSPIHGAAERIADAEAFLNEYRIQRSGLVASLLEQHKTGNLSAVYTELLAQLINADKKKAEDALSN